MSTDDEDWLYRRGRYAPDTASGQENPEPARSGGPSAGPVPAAAPAPIGPSAVGGAAAARPPAPPRARRPQRGARGEDGARPARRWTRRRTLAVVLAVVLGYLLGVPLATWPFLGRVDATPDGDRPAGQPGQLFVLAGSDAREDLTAEEQQRLGTGNDPGRRADTIMLLYRPRTGKAALISIPRDSYLAIPGHGKNKINAAYALGGPSLLVGTIENATGLRVDGFAEVGFDGFVHVVDAVGGIEMCPEQAIKDRDSSLDIPAGCQLMDGVTALGYVRMRKADPRGDLGRAERQREMLTALASRVMSPATIALPWRWWGVNRSIASAVRIGSDDGLGELIGLGRAVVRVGTGRGLMFSVPIANANAQTPAGSSVLWDDARAGELFDAIRSGDGAALERFAG